MRSIKRGELTSILIGAVLLISIAGPLVHYSTGGDFSQSVQYTPPSSAQSQPSSAPSTQTSDHPPTQPSCPTVTHEETLSKLAIGGDCEDYDCPLLGCGSWCRPKGPVKKTFTCETSLTQTCKHGWGCFGIHSAKGPCDDPPSTRFCPPWCDPDMVSTIDYCHMKCEQECVLLAEPQIVPE